MGNPAELYLIESDKLANHLVLPANVAKYSRRLFEADDERDHDPRFHEPLPLHAWIQLELVRREEELGSERSSYLAELLLDYLLKQDTGITPYLYFEKRWAVNFDLEHFYPHLSPTIQQRIKFIFSGTGSPLPRGYELALSQLNGIHSFWAFFTRQEVVEMAPVIMATIEDKTKQVLYEEEWRDLLVAHQRYNLATRTNFTYDLVALSAMY